MMNTIVWVLVTLASTNVYTVGPEFTSQQKCEVAAQAVYKAVDESRWGMNIRKPLCVRIEK
jgi:hypothetical protein